MQLSIIIVNYNIKFFLEQCLCSVEKAIKDIDAEICVVDNCSADNSIEYLQEKFNRVKFISAGSNLGFSKANNMALKQCTGKYILFLNPDTILPEDALQGCLTFFETTANAGAAGVRMIDGRGKFLAESKRSFPSPVVSFFKLTGLSAVFPTSKFFNRYALGYLAEHAIHEVDVLSGACMIVKKDILTELGAFDEIFFMYGEDIDLSFRIQQAGYKNFYLGNITILHFKGESTKRGSLNYVRLFYKAMRIFVKKHYSGNDAWATNIFLHLAIYLRSIISLMAAPFTLLYYSIFKSNTGSRRSFLLTGDDASCAEAQQILQGNGTQSQKITTAEIQAASTSSSNTVVFCTGTLEYKKTLELVQQPGNNCTFKWHGCGTKSIAGSDHKNLTGEVYAGN